jgi:MYXO-CTERM domain-containing protein
VRSDPARTNTPLTGWKTEMRTRPATLLFALPVLGIAASAMAGNPAPELQVGWTVDGMSDGGALTGSGLGAGMYSYSAVTTGDTFEINWSFLVTDNGADDSFQIIAAALGVTNIGDTNSVFGLDILLPVDLGMGNALYGGGLGGSITGAEFGGFLSTVDDNTALWTAMVDGNVIASLIDAPFELTSTAFGSADIEGVSFGDPIPSLAFAAPQESVSMHLDFILGAGTTLAITSNYVGQVPSPGAAALLVVAGVTRRRRRLG